MSWLIDGSFELANEIIEEKKGRREAKVTGRGQSREEKGEEIHCPGD